MASFGKIAAQLCVGVRRELVSPGKVRIILPWGFPYEAFGANMVVKPWHILSLVESGRALSFNRVPGLSGDPFLRVEELYSAHGVFQGSARLTVAKEMYDLSVPKTPVTLEKELVYVGTSSMNILTRVLLPAAGPTLTLASCEVQSVLVDSATRRPSPYPPWWREHFAGFSSPERRLKVKVEMAPPPERAGFEPGNGAGDADDPGATRDPTSSRRPIADRGGARTNPSLGEATKNDGPMADGGVMSHDLRINPSDTDPYGHANWTCYLRLCLDALTAVPSQDVPHLGHLRHAALRQADLSYVREGSGGQEVTVRFWPDSAAPGAVHFNVVDGKSRQLITYVFLQFYSPQEVQLVGAKL